MVEINRNSKIYIEIIEITIPPLRGDRGMLRVNKKVQQ